MSQLQRKQLDKDGDGVIEAHEVYAHAHTRAQPQHASPLHFAPQTRSNIPANAAFDVLSQLKALGYSNNASGSGGAGRGMESSGSPQRDYATGSDAPQSSEPAPVFNHRNVFATRRPQEFRGKGAAMWEGNAISEDMPGGSLPRSRDKGALAPLDKNAPVAPLSAAGRKYEERAMAALYEYEQRAKTEAQLGRKDLGDGKTVLMHPVLGKVVVTR